MRVYSVFDKTAEEFGPPFVAKNDGVAMRQFNDFRREKLPPHIVDEFALYYLADWDHSIGISNLNVIPAEVKPIDGAMSTKVSLEEVR